LRPANIITDITDITDITTTDITLKSQPLLPKHRPVKSETLKCSRLAEGAEAVEDTTVDAANLVVTDITRATPDTAILLPLPLQRPLPLRLHQKHLLVRSAI